ncbi:hypothetical protein HAX54_048900 [Datura stramonium]|uniref:Uncharacterized protein n=1 Tax=Datura stramonium TaxID=4076 RepID=A0ABS8WNT2_DATST|nr:hypothetical protein [Datura stramonium]
MKDLPFFGYITLGIQKAEDCLYEVKIRSSKKSELHHDAWRDRTPWNNYKQPEENEEGHPGTIGRVSNDYSCSCAHDLATKRSLTRGSSHNDPRKSNNQSQSACPPALINVYIKREKDISNPFQCKLSA